MQSVVSYFILYSLLNRMQRFLALYIYAVFVTIRDNFKDIKSVVNKNFGLVFLLLDGGLRIISA